jgi:hypothetical protein
MDTTLGKHEFLQQPQIKATIINNNLAFNASKCKNTIDDVSTLTMFAEIVCLLKNILPQWGSNR